MQGNEIEIFEDNEESYFDKYLNEVLYLFEKSGADVIVFEDIDRYNSVQIFQESQIQNQQQQAKTILAAAPKQGANVLGSSRGPRKSWILIAVIAALAILIGVLIWIVNGGAK